MTWNPIAWTKRNEPYDIAVISLADPHHAHPRVFRWSADAGPITSSSPRLSGESPTLEQAMANADEALRVVREAADLMARAQEMLTSAYDRR